MSDRIESKIDRIQEDITDLKVKVEKIDTRMDMFDAHITGDEKIISKLLPVLDKFPSVIKIVEDYEFKERLKDNRIASIKKTGLISGVILSLAAVGKLIIGFFTT